MTSNQGRLLAAGVSSGVAAILTIMLLRFDFLLAVSVSGFFMAIGATFGVAMATRLGVESARLRTARPILWTIILAKPLVGVAALSLGELVGYTTTGNAYLPREPWYGMGVATLFALDGGLLAFVTGRTIGSHAVSAYVLFPLLGAVIPLLGYLDPELWRFSLTLWVAATVALLTIITTRQRSLPVELTSG
jgi:hypothetical protein